MLDLNSLIPPGAGLELSHALAITDSGEIVGLGVPPGCPPSEDDVCGHVYVLVPCNASEPTSCQEEILPAPSTNAAKHSAQYHLSASVERPCSNPSPVIAGSL